MVQGKLFLRDDPYVIVDVSGIGYKIFVNQRVLATMSKTGEACRFFTYTHVREEALELYGFSELQDLKLFEYLIGVSGVGCKTAMGIFSVGTRGDIVNAIVAGDTAFFTAVPRMGRKNAQKLIIELRGKVGSTEDLELPEAGEGNEVIAALEAIGFSRREATIALKAINGEGETIQEKVRLALKQLGK